MSPTSGPWIADSLGSSSGVAVRSSTGAIVAVCKHIPAPDMASSECAANALLVATAPDFLAAAVMLIEAADEGDADKAMDARDALRAAVTRTRSVD